MKIAASPKVLVGFVRRLLPMVQWLQQSQQHPTGLFRQTEPWCILSPTGMIGIEQKNKGKSSTGFLSIFGVYRILESEAPTYSHPWDLSAATYQFYARTDRITSLRTVSQKFSVQLLILFLLSIWSPLITQKTLLKTQTNKLLIKILELWNFKLLFIVWPPRLQNPNSVPDWCHCHHYSTWWGNVGH